MSGRRRDDAFWSGLLTLISVGGLVTTLVLTAVRQR
ncbi:hypothetical protein P3T26_004648 [Streptomyces sp. MAA16]|nr:hypothetical protein [Streptomyces sp. MAA16]